jgi:septal ring factor EnvC (AmiA/AmiB activator)
VLREDLTRARSVLAERQESLRRVRVWARLRLRAWLKGGHRGLLSILFSSRDLSDYRKRRRVLARSIDLDLRRLSDYLREVRAVKRLESEISLEEAHARALRAEVVRRRDELARLRRMREAEIEALVQRGVPLRVRRARRSARRRLERLVRSLRSEMTRMQSLQRLRGRLPHPVNGPVDLPFGTIREPPFGAVTLHPGWHYRAPRGAPVGAIYSGQVVFAEELPGYGKVVIVDHFGKVHSLCAQLGEIRVRKGERVDAGQTLGTVGGDALHGPGLYFELRVRGRPVDPERWITPRESGQVRAAARMIDSPSPAR